MKNADPSNVSVGRRIADRLRAGGSSLFGPGAIIASLTIGAGELVFSSRAGALFGERALFYFAVILLLKWALVAGAARPLILAGAHPLHCARDLPGPRGWFPFLLFLLALICFPVWVCFHAGTIGTLLGWLARSSQSPLPASTFFWGLAILLIVLAISFSKGYSVLEKAQTIIVLLMLAGVLISALLLRPQLKEVFAGLLIPMPLRYPDWVNTPALSEIARRPVWVEVATYAGIIGGSSYDYLAYVAYMREKNWGWPSSAAASGAELQRLAQTPAAAKRWLRPVWVDTGFSFLSVLIFSGVFVICGALVLRPQHQAPVGSDLLNLQVQFIEPLFPQLKWLYFAGAFLAMFGTLYGTIEVAPALLRELWLSLRPERSNAPPPAWLRPGAVAWAGGGGLALMFSLAIAGESRAPGWIALLTPANLFTGVLGCGLICLLNLWIDRTLLPRALRMGWVLLAINAAAALIFLVLGLKAYWDNYGFLSWAVLLGTVVIGWAGAWIWQKVSRRKPALI